METAGPGDGHEEVAEVVVCLACEDGANSVPSEVTICADCRRPVWISLDMRRYVPNARVLCEKCAIALGRQHGSGEIQAIPEWQLKSLQEELGLDEEGVRELVREYAKSLEEGHTWKYGEGDQPR